MGGRTGNPNYHPGMHWAPGSSPEPGPRFGPGPGVQPTPRQPSGGGWGVLPLVTFGLAAPFSFLCAGTRTPGWKFTLVGVGYGAAYLGIFAGLFGSGSVAGIA